MVDSHPTVVSVDGDPDEQAATVDALSAAGFEVIQETTVSGATSALSSEIDCVVTATTLPDGTGFDVLERVRAAYADCPVVLFGEASPADVPADSQSHIVEYLPRSIPGVRERLVSLIKDATMGGYQVAYPVPEDEQARLEALAAYDVTDFTTAETFDRLTKLVVSHFDIDKAFVGLVDEHEERFVACEGADWQTVAREDTICTHTILEHEVMVVEDLTEDPRFASNDQLRELDVRSYAGAQLTTPGGQTIGALCCLDSETRSYTTEECQDLQLFADEAMEQLELRRRLNERLPQETA
ncbi:small GAF containing sensor [Halobacteriales archaeon QS_4_62_28]|nr:MAG: small GAF containing sensor [Halobacteriales archaeon QS_4_62_28]